MIQRKQSLWLLIAALLSAGVFCFDLYRFHTSVSKPLLDKTVPVDTVASLRVSDHFPSLLIALVMTALPLVTIFMFRNRKRQVAMITVNLIAALSFIGMELARVSSLSSTTPPATNGTYWIGSVLPVAAVVFLVMAIVGIRSDEKLVRSADRLR